ncbi:reverse transcriptase domain-containing protein [Tanacetum coccineum]
MLARCEEMNLVLNYEKCHFMVKEGIVLGHKISRSGIKVDKAKVDVIASLPYPTNVKGIRSFLGHAGFYRRFIKDFSKIARPMTQLLMKDAKFDFSDECIKSFDILRDKLITTPVIIAPNWDIDFELMCDASDYAVGAVLGTAYKTPIGGTPFRIVYEKAFHLPIELEHKAYWALKNTDVYKHSRAYKERTKRWHDSKIKDKEFQEGEEVKMEFVKNTSNLMNQPRTRSEMWVGLLEKLGWNGGILSFLCANCFVNHSRQSPWKTRIIYILLEITPDLAMRAIGTPLSSSKGTMWERTRLRLFQFSFRDQASNWLERLPSGSISTWEDFTTRFLAQFFPSGRIAKLRNDILMFQQHEGEFLSKAWTRFKDLPQKFPHHGTDRWLQIQIFMTMSPFILSAKLTAPPVANPAIIMPMNLRKSLRTLPFTTMRAGMTQVTPSNRSKLFLRLKAPKNT